MRPSPKWEDIFPQYDTFFVDLVGVIHDGITPFPKAIEALNRLSPDQNLVFVSNTPRPSDISLKKIQSYGIHSPFSVITSGDFTRSEIQKDPSLFFHWGGAKNSDLLQGISLNVTPDLHLAEKILLTLFLEEEEEDPEADGIIDLIATKNIPVFCANPDHYALHGKQIRKCAGYFGEKIKKRGRNVTLLGKPIRRFYEFVENQLPFSINRKKCLMIGDTLETDILGAQNYGIDSVLVLSGITERGRIQQGISLKEMTQSISPTYILPHL